MSSLPNPETIKHIASAYGYAERRKEVSSTLFFKDDTQKTPTLINIFYTTGGVMTKLSHPKKGYNQLWRSDAYDSAESLTLIFADPRVHTEQGYRHSGNAKRGCINCGMQKKKSEYSKNQWRKGPGNCKCTSCVQQKQQNKREERSRGGDTITSNNGNQTASTLAWNEMVNEINDAVTCDNEGCNNTSPTIRCICPSPVYYCSEHCKRRHWRIHSHDCRDLDTFRNLTASQDPNLNSGLCNAHPSILSQMRKRAVAAQMLGVEENIDFLLVQAESIHQLDEDWNSAIKLYQRILLMSIEGEEDATPSHMRQVRMGLSRCFYELGKYDKAIHFGVMAIEMNRWFPRVHTYVALSYLESGNQDLAIITMKQAVLYEAHYSDETMQENMYLLGELVLKQRDNIECSSTVKPRIDVYYGRTDDTPGYKEYTAVVVKTTETNENNLQYFGDLYEPRPDCDYKILFEVPMSKLPSLCKKARVNENSVGGWIKSPLKEVILEYWKRKI